MVGIFPNDAAAIRLVGTTERQIIVAAEIASDGLDFAQLDPMIAAAERELEEAGVTERPGVVLADAGYWSNGHIDALRERGMTPIVAPDAHNRDGPRKTRLAAHGGHRHATLRRRGFRLGKWRGSLLRGTVIA